jgi:hypothetical protein
MPKAMRQIDMHGKRLKDAEELFYRLLDEVRLKKAEEEIFFITGIGPIQDMLKKLSKEQGLNHYVPLANRGCIVVEFE